MLNRFFYLAIILLISACTTFSKPPDSELIHYYQAETTKPYDDVIAELEIAISEHNFRVTGHSRVGKVIRDRGSENFPNYDTVQFCNLSHAEVLLTLSPHAVSYMPCNIVTYEWRGKTIIKTPLLPVDSDKEAFNRLTKKMNKTLKQIVDFAAEQ